jgi:hypothetical protein
MSVIRDPGIHKQHETTVYLYIYTYIYLDNSLPTVFRRIFVQVCWHGGVLNFMTFKKHFWGGTMCCTVGRPARLNTVTSSGELD